MFTICKVIFEPADIVAIYSNKWKKRIFVLQKLVKSAEKVILLFVFVCFDFTEISYFLSFPSNENVRKQHFSANVYFCINMKFSYMIAGRKDEIFMKCCIVTKTSDFLLVFRSTFHWQYLNEKMKFSVVSLQKQAIGQLFVEDVYIFPIISFSLNETWSKNRKSLFFLIYGNECSFINFLKSCSQKLGY